MGSQYVDDRYIEQRLQVALMREFPERDVSVRYDGNRSPRLITATVDGVTATQETWFIDESFGTMVRELAARLRKQLLARRELPAGS